MLTKIPIDGKVLKKLGKQRRRLLLQSSHIANDLASLMKLSVYSHKRGVTEEETAAQMSMFFMLARLQLSKLWEVSEYWDKVLLEPVRRPTALPKMWNMITHLFHRGTRCKKRHVRDNLGFSSDLNDAVVVAYNLVKADPLFGRVRNKMEFHYDHGRLDSELPALGDDFRTEIYLHESSGNSFYRISEDLLLRCLMSELDESDLEAFVTRYSERLNRSVHLVLQANELLIGEVLTDHLDDLNRNGRLVECEVRSVPLSSGFSPFFVTRDAEG